MAIIRTGTLATIPGLDSMETGSLQAIIDYIQTITKNYYEESIQIVEGAPASVYELTGPLSPMSTITLPADARGILPNPEYAVSDRSLRVFLNGQVLARGIDWLEVGTAGDPSTSIQMVDDLVVGDTLTLRLEIFGNFNG